MTAPAGLLKYEPVMTWTGEPPAGYVHNPMPGLPLSGPMSAEFAANEELRNLRSASQNSRAYDLPTHDEVYRVRCSLSPTTTYFP